MRQQRGRSSGAGAQGPSSGPSPKMSRLKGPSQRTLPMGLFEGPNLPGQRRDAATRKGMM
eukprot:CAMPEP_0184236396 /NCGR_PEP_ID=MMETSP0976-20121227/25806_1 /TAXON_ID=483370 /ORGANISM="non described non described, Strain CCMP2097" /LENGTH=59 /DNA_ID=CAMNT_0026541495 /DNA_START=170 /DNA_END=346 /DNA_ORIENTATION=+